MENREQISISKDSGIPNVQLIQEEIVFGRWFIGIMIFFLIPGSTVLIGQLLGYFISSSVLYGYLGMMFICLGLIFVLHEINKGLCQILNLSKILEEYQNNNEKNLRGLLYQCEKIHTTLLSLNGIEKYGKIMRSSDNLRKIKDDTIEFIICTLNKIRTQLSSKFDESILTLENAQSEVESTIQGTPELNQVSELQKARLDRQIEQFEELQRVLVKV